MPSNNLVYRGTKKIISTMEDVENKSSTLCGSFKTMFGNIGTTYHLWRHENFDEAQALRTMWISNQASNFIDFSKYYTGDHEFQAQFLPFLRKIQGLILILLSFTTIKACLSVNLTLGPKYPKFIHFLSTDIINKNIDCKA